MKTDTGWKYLDVVLDQKPPTYKHKFVYFPLLLFPHNLLLYVNLNICML